VRPTRRTRFEDSTSSAAHQRALPAYASSLRLIEYRTGDRAANYRLGPIRCDECGWTCKLADRRSTGWYTPHPSTLYVDQCRAVEFNSRMIESYSRSVYCYRRTHIRDAIGRRRVRTVQATGCLSPLISTRSTARQPALNLSVRISPPVARPAVNERSDYPCGLSEWVRYKAMSSVSACTVWGSCSKYLSKTIFPVLVSTVNSHARSHGQ